MILAFIFILIIWFQSLQEEDKKEVKDEAKEDLRATKDELSRRIYELEKRIAELKSDGHNQ